jgi:serine protease Do
VLRIDAKDLPVVRLGDPKSLEVGDPVLAIGAPYGLEQTATQGIVSAKGRSLPGDAVVPFIQTDAAVNPGNSGGPLFDGSGSVVGINAQIYSRSGGFQGLSFAIPIDVALKVKDQIVATGKARHGAPGRDGAGPEPAARRFVRPEAVGGALVSNVAPAAPRRGRAEVGRRDHRGQRRAGARSGELSSLIGMSAPGERVKLKVWRDQPSATIEASSAAPTRRRRRSSPTREAGGGQLGLTLRPLTREEKRAGQARRRPRRRGRRGAAARAGIQPGDVLLAINGKPVQSIDQVKGVIAASRRASRCSCSATARRSSCR